MMPFWYWISQLELILRLISIIIILIKFTEYARSYYRLGFSQISKWRDIMKSWLKKNALPFLVIVVGGLLLVVLCWLLYLGIYLGLEAMFYKNDPQSFPADILRAICGGLLIIVSVFVLRLKINEVLKAMILVAPMSVGMIIIVLGFYEIIP